MALRERNSNNYCYRNSYSNTQVFKESNTEKKPESMYKSDKKKQAKRLRVTTFAIAITEVQ